MSPECRSLAAHRKRSPVTIPALIEAFPDLAVNADARFELAELLSHRGEHEEAIKLLKQAFDKEPPPELTDKIRVRWVRACWRKATRSSRWVSSMR